MDKLSGYPFVVNDRPFCVWDFGMTDQNIKFLKQFDPSYFETVAKQNRELLSTNLKQHAATNLRITYSHGLESLFSMLFAGLQAPYCVPAWLTKCWPKDLKGLIAKVGNPAIPLLNRFSVSSVTWESISQIMHAEMVEKNEENSEETIKGYADLWRRLAYQYSNELEQDEYNSIKHGFRIVPGGFSLSMQKESTLGVPDSSAAPHTFSGSQFGSTFFTDELFEGKKPHFYLSSHSLNWDAIKLASGLELIALSLSNIRSALLFHNGITGNSYSWPKESRLIDEFKRSLIEIKAFSVNPEIDSKWISDGSEEDIINAYGQKLDRLGNSGT